MGWRRRSSSRGKAAPRPSKLDPYKKQIVRWLESHPYTAAQIFLRLREAGYTGGISIVKDYVHKIRPPHTPAFLTLSFAPGECCPGGLGAVRHHQRGQHPPTAELLRHGAVLQPDAVRRVHRQRDHGALPGLPRQRLRLLRRGSRAGYGGQPALRGATACPWARRRSSTHATRTSPITSASRSVPCGVGQAHEKGRVENAVGYIKKNFLAGLELSDFALVNPAARQWLETVANVRIHGSTKRQPVELFQTEKPQLKPLPRPALRCGGHPVRAGQQPVPRDGGHQHLLRARRIRRGGPDAQALPGCLCLYHQDKLIARHVRCYDRRRDFEHPDHPKSPARPASPGAGPEVAAAAAVTDAQGRGFYQGLAERRLNILHHVRQIVALAEIYGTEKTARAIEDALEFQAFSCEYVANLLEQRQRHPAGTGRPAPDPPAGPAGPGTARAQPVALRRRTHENPTTEPCPGEIHEPPQDPCASPDDDLRRQLQLLKLPFMLEHFEELAGQAGDEQWSHVEFLARLIEGEAALRQDRARQRRIQQARFPVLKTLEQFDFTWPSKINRPAVQNLFRLKFIEDKANAILIGGVGLGKSHLAIALGYAACQAGFRVRFATAIDIINSLSAAQKAGRLAKEMKKYTRPSRKSHSGSASGEFLRLPMR